MDCAIHGSRSINGMCLQLNMMFALKPYPCLVLHDIIHLTSTSDLVCIQVHCFPCINVQQFHTHSLTPAVLCPRLDPPANAKYSYSNEFRGDISVATVLCNEGYAPSSTDAVTRTCQSSGEWSGMDPVCAGTYETSCVC